MYIYSFIKNQFESYLNEGGHVYILGLRKILFDFEVLVLPQLLPIQTVKNMTLPIQHCKIRVNFSKI